MKGYGNFMSKKGFHPGSYANQKRVQEAEAKAAAKRKHDEETLEQYKKEQELYQQRILVSRESKDKLSLSFMYDPPPGTSQQDKGKDQDQIPKFESKREKFQPKVDLTKKSNAKRRDDSSSDDEPSIKLEWKREEPKAKKTQIDKKEPTRQIKKERHQ